MKFTCCLLCLLAAGCSRPAEKPSAGTPPAALAWLAANPETASQPNADSLDRPSKKDPGMQETVSLDATVDTRFTFDGCKGTMQETLHYTTPEKEKLVPADTNVIHFSVAALDSGNISIYGVGNPPSLSIPSTEPLTINWSRTDGAYTGTKPAHGLEIKLASAQKAEEDASHWRQAIAACRQRTQ